MCIKVKFNINQFFKIYSSLYNYTFLNTFVKKEMTCGIKGEEDTLESYYILKYYSNSMKIVYIFYNEILFIAFIIVHLGEMLL